MKIVDVRAKTDDELKATVLQLSKEQYNLRFSKASGQLENTSRVRAIRRTIAKICTVQGERQRVAVAAKKKAEK